MLNQMYKHALRSLGNAYCSRACAKHGVHPHSTGAASHRPAAHVGAQEYRQDEHQHADHRADDDQDGPVGATGTCLGCTHTELGRVKFHDTMTYVRLSVLWRRCCCEPSSRIVVTPATHRHVQTRLEHCWAGCASCSRWGADALVARTAGRRADGPAAGRRAHGLGAARARDDDAVVQDHALPAHARLTQYVWPLRRAPPGMLRPSMHGSATYKRLTNLCCQC